MLSYHDAIKTAILWNPLTWHGNDRIHYVPNRHSLSYHTISLSSLCRTVWRVQQANVKDLEEYMMTSSNGNIFRVTGLLCGEFTGPGEFPTQRPVMRSFDVFFDLRLNKRLSKQSWGWWLETLSCLLWRHCNAIIFMQNCLTRSAG